MPVDVIVAEGVKFESVSCANLLNISSGTALLSQIAHSNEFWHDVRRIEAGGNMRLDGQRTAGKRRLSAANWLATILVWISSPAMAYLDPGATYIAIQGLLGLVAGSWAAVFVYRRRIVDALRRSSRRTATNRDTASTMLEAPQPKAHMSQNKNPENRSALP